ncbi:cobyrinic acid a,c-diamide synthase [Gordonia effusa NBRC 100432]|uniref:Hydrogenobyrinate a,c-diamide synthase n=1 Tax=Gordonia effusa NBRC 100432 TaxID=1077974 RepID=H0R247_9ACTN|nr:cobyrinate a,c-diamide synthase [Gordonia effusa]GAB19152.1 cobyrinic acid a,c-diamide synthase [Gordonia effusa NBRC 100432]
MSSTPAIVIAAPSSGSGKTTVTTGLIGALRRAGLKVAPFKVGPDFIDPGYHTVAAGRPGRNLDPNLVGAELISPLFAAGCAGADIAVVEGVMGLFDGRIGTEVVGATPGGFGSTAQVASILGAPVVLVVDAAGHSQSLAALLHGFASFDASVTIAGVILNRVGSPRHESVLRAACVQVGLPVLGAVRRDAGLAVPSRHLGLIPAAERAPEAERAVDAMAAAIGGAIDLAAVEATARRRSQVNGPLWSSSEALGDKVIGDPVIAMAGGAAFTFGYAEHAELLAAAGADVVTFDPLHDRLPDRTAGVVIGGGFPEEYAEQLAANELLRDDLRAHVRGGGPLHGECAGYLYLCGALDNHPMSGVLDATAMFTQSLTLGYRDAVCLQDNVLYRAGERVTGHEFHRSTVTGVGDAAWGWRTDTGAATDGLVSGGIHGSFLHIHPAAVPRAIARFVAAATSYRGPV